MLRNETPRAIPAGIAALLLGLVAVAALPAQAGDIPPDIHGLPRWEVRIFDDFPVRIELESAEALRELLRAVPIASFHREQVRPAGPGSGLWIFEPRVTEAEVAALRAAGYAPERIPDRERKMRRAMEAAWAAQAEAGGDALRFGARGQYHTHAQIGAILQQTALDFPAIADFFDIGTSVQGREIWGIRITDNVGVEEAEPEVRLAGTMHGNEPPSQEMLLFLVGHLTARYGIDPDVTDLVDNYEIHILPCLNPDGLTAGSRWNARGVDLNRNYPVPDGSIGDDGTWTEEPETVAFRSFGLAHDFVVSANGHSGALVVNYPWDYTYTLTPDDDAIVRLSLEYSTYNLPMFNGSFPQGITNGAQWYIVHGSLQDWSYDETGCIDVTLELSNSHWPPASQLDALWNDNRESFLHYIRAARYGVHGVVTASDTGVPLAATITVPGIDKPVFSDPDHGDFYKLLDTGTYDLIVSADGYQSRWITPVATAWGTPTFLDVTLDPDPTGVEPVAQVGELRLEPFPNPFRRATTLRFSSAGGGPARLSVFDARGRRVRTLLEATLSPGSHTMPWRGISDRGETLASGVYFVRLELDGGVRVRKVTLAR